MDHELEFVLKAKDETTGPVSKARDALANLGELYDRQEKLKIRLAEANRRVEESTRALAGADEAVKKAWDSANYDQEVEIREIVAKAVKVEAENCKTLEDQLKKVNAEIARATSGHGKAAPSIEGVGKAAEGSSKGVLKLVQAFKNLTHGNITGALGNLQSFFGDIGAKGALAITAVVAALKALRESIQRLRETARKDELESFASAMRASADAAGTMSQKIEHARQQAELLATAQEKAAQRARQLGAMDDRIAAANDRSELAARLGGVADPAERAAIEKEFAARDQERRRAAIERNERLELEENGAKKQKADAEIRAIEEAIEQNKRQEAVEKATRNRAQKTYDENMTWWNVNMNEGFEANLVSRIGANILTGFGSWSDPQGAVKHAEEAQKTADAAAKNIANLQGERQKLYDRLAAARQSRESLDSDDEGIRRSAEAARAELDAQQAEAKRKEEAVAEADKRREIEKVEKQIAAMEERKRREDDARERAGTQQRMADALRDSEQAQRDIDAADARLAEVESRKTVSGRMSKEEAKTQRQLEREERKNARREELDIKRAKDNWQRLQDFRTLESDEDLLKKLNKRDRGIIEQELRREEDRAKAEQDRVDAETRKRMADEEAANAKKEMEKWDAVESIDTNLKDLKSTLTRLLAVS